MSLLLFFAFLVCYRVLMVVNVRDTCLHRCDVMYVTYIIKLDET